MKHFLFSNSKTRESKMYKQRGIVLDSDCIIDISSSVDTNNDQISYDFDEKIINLITSFQNLDFNISAKIIKEMTHVLTLEKHVIFFNRFSFEAITRQFLVFFDPVLYKNMIDSLLPLLVAWTYYQNNNRDFLNRKLFDFLLQLIEDADELMDSRKYALYLLGNVILDFPEGCDLFYDLNGIQRIIKGIPSINDIGFSEAATQVMNVFAINVNGNEEKACSLISFLQIDSISSLFYYNFAYTSQNDFLFLLNFIKASETTALFVFRFLNFKEILYALDSVSSNKYGLVGLFRILKALLKQVPDNAVRVLQGIEFEVLTEFFEENKVSSDDEKAFCDFMLVFFQEYPDLIILAIQSKLINLFKHFLEASSLKIKIKVLEIFSFIFTIDSNTYPIDIIDYYFIDLLVNLLETDWDIIILQILILLDLIAQKCIDLSNIQMAIIVLNNDLEMYISPLTTHANSEVSEKAIILMNDIQKIKKHNFFDVNDDFLFDDEIFDEF